MDSLNRFVFSQSSLQDFVDCRRRFYLRYVQRVAWPALQSEPALENEQHVLRGERFHRLVQQYLTGIPEPRLTRMAEADEDENLLRWWENFLDCVPGELNGKKRVESTLWAPLGQYRLIAKYDLVLIGTDGRVTIYDWKTSLRRPRREWLIQRMQTHVYPYLLVQAGAAFNQGCPLEPEQIQMVYWFAEPEHGPEVIPYRREAYAADGEYLLWLVQEVRSLNRDSFRQCDTDTACKYCVYRSLCERGIKAGDLSQDGYETTERESLDFSLEQIGEIGF